MSFHHTYNPLVNNSKYLYLAATKRKNMKHFLVLICVIATFCSSLSSQNYISLWPANKMPNSKGIKVTEHEENQRITLVNKPGMWIFETSKEENNGAAILIFPPGGYQKLTYNIAGFQFAKWLNTLGFTAFVVKYRLPHSPDIIDSKRAPIQDAQRAMKWVRLHAENYQIDTARIGVMGASAGGHLTATMCTFTKDYSKIGDEYDEISIHPAFGIMISPVIDMGQYTHKGSLHNLLGQNPSTDDIKKYSLYNMVSAYTPPCFLAHALNDNSVSPMNSMLFYEALINHNIVGSTIHVFPEGGHGLKLRNNPGSGNMWVALCEEWLRHQEIIK